MPPEEITPDEFRALWRRIGIPAAIEFAVDLALMVTLAVVTFERPNGTGKILATAAVVLILILWTLGIRRRLAQWQRRPG